MGGSLTVNYIAFSSKCIYSALALLPPGLSAANLSAGDLAGCWGMGLPENISLSCAVTRMNVVRLLISFKDLAPGQIVTNFKDTKELRHERTNVSARRANSTQDLLNGVFDCSPVRNVRALALARAVPSNTAAIFFHGHIAAHAVKLPEMIAINDHVVAAPFSVTSKHTTQHDEISSSTKCLGHVAGACAAAVAHDKAAEAVRSICALNHSRQLGVADARQLARGANLQKCYNLSLNERKETGLRCLVQCQLSQCRHRKE